MVATSGTFATTVIDTSAIIEHAIRRCKLTPAQQTPETVLIAKENLYMVLLNLSNRGLNLWCVDRLLQGLTAGQATYSTPAGTIDVLNVTYSQPTLASVTFSATAAGGKATCATAEVVKRVGVRVSANYTGSLIISSSADDVTYTVLTTAASNTYVAGDYAWIDLPVIDTNTYFTVESAAVPYPAIDDIQIVTQVYDLPVKQWNRDTYAVINNKYAQSRPSTNYFLEKKLVPQITLWPVPTNSTDHLTLYVHRQVQDVGTLSQQLEIPQRWVDGIVWLLASKLAFELPSVDDARAQLLTQMADKQEFEAEQAESDGAPIYLTPGIGVYTR